VGKVVKDKNMSDPFHVSRSNLRQGAVYMLVGLVWGMMVPATPFPRLALTAHIQLTVNGVMFLVAGLVILRLPVAKSGVSAKILVAGPWLTWPVMLTEMANAWWGARNTLPIAAGQAGAAGAEAWQEGAVTAAHLVGALVLLVYWGVILAGLFRNPVKGEEATSQPPASTPQEKHPGAGHPPG
jgi:hydroxylaminobenzene mutase